MAVLGTAFGAVADSVGICRGEGLPAGRYNVQCSHIGYGPHTLRDLSTDGLVQIADLTASAVALPGVVVSALRRPQTFAAAPVSIAVADAERIGDHNAFTLAEPLRYVSGISQVGGQLNIRGSSGYSRGVGSRILMLVDGFPLLAADLGDIKWDAVPLQQVERVEVVKGAGSALYGTGALGGVINVLTREPGDNSATRFRLLSGLYSQPAHRAWRWTETAMRVAGFDINRDVVVGSTALALSVGHNRTTGYHENGDARRYHLYAKAQHRVSSSTRWRTMVHWALDDHGVFVQWRDRNQPLAVPAVDEPANTTSWKLHVNSEYYSMARRDLGYSLRSAYYRTGFENNAAAGGMASAGHKITGEGKIDWVGWRGWDGTVGLAATGDLVRSPSNFLGTRDLMTLASYVQGVYPLNPVAELTAGLRYDWTHRSGAGSNGSGVCAAQQQTEGKTAGEFSPQVGLSFRPQESTALRASFGRGFRGPSVSEVFAQAQVSGLQVCPNPDLGPERAWSYETGFKQQIGRGLALDGALFWNEFRGLIEGRPDIRASAGVPVARFQNLARARVRGFEGEALLALPLNVGGRIAYTFVDGVEYIGHDEVLPPYCHGDYETGAAAPLPYRARHAVNLGLDGVYAKIAAMMNFQYFSRFARVSGLFPECGRDQVPVYLLNARVSRRIGRLRFNFRIDNMLQYHYATTERKIRPLRRFTLSMDGEL